MGCTRRHVVIGALAALSGGFPIGMINYTFGVFVAALSSENPTWTRTELNGAFSAGQVISNVFAPLVGQLIDRKGVRLVVSASLCSVSLGYAILALNASIEIVYLAYIIMGVGYVGASLLGPGKLVGTWFPPQLRGRVLGLVAAGNNTSGLVFVQLATALSLSSGWRWTAGVFSILLVLLAILYATLVRSHPPDLSLKGAHNEEDDEKDGLDSSGHFVKELADSHVFGEVVEELDSETFVLEIVDPESESITSVARTERQKGEAQIDNITLKQAVRTTLFWSSAIGMTLCYTTYSGVLTQMLPALLAEGVSQADSANMVSIVALSGIASKVLAGRLSETLTARVTLIVCLIGQIIGLIIFVLADGCLGCYWTACAVYGLSFGGVGALLPLVSMETFGLGSYGEIFGGINFLFIAPSMLGPIVTGASFDATGTYRIAFIAIGGAFALSIVFLLMGLDLALLRARLEVVRRSSGCRRLCVPHCGSVDIAGAAEKAHEAKALRKIADEEAPRKAAARRQAEEDAATKAADNIVIDMVTKEEAREKAEVRRRATVETLKGAIGDEAASKVTRKQARRHSAEEAVRKTREAKVIRKVDREYALVVGEKATADEEMHDASDGAAAEEHTTRGAGEKERRRSAQQEEGVKDIAEEVERSATEEHVAARDAAEAEVVLKAAEEESLAKCEVDENELLAKTKAPAYLEDDALLKVVDDQLLQIIEDLVLTHASIGDQKVSNELQSQT